MFLNKIRNIFCVPDTIFLSATNVARAGKRGNICAGNNVSSFARAFMLTSVDQALVFPFAWLSWYPAIIETISDSAEHRYIYWYFWHGSPTSTPSLHTSSLSLLGFFPLAACVFHGCTLFHSRSKKYLQYFITLCHETGRSQKKLMTEAMSMEDLWLRQSVHGWVLLLGIKSVYSDKSERNYRSECLGWPVTSYGGVKVRKFYSGDLRWFSFILNSILSSKLDNLAFHATFVSGYFGLPRGCT